jgi:hypothetical protein
MDPGLWASADRVTRGALLLAVVALAMVVGTAQTT